MKNLTGIFSTMALILAGCHHAEPRTANDKVHIKAPFTDVRVGENGGTKVNAPFTNVETTRYKEATPTFAPPTPPAVRQTSSLDNFNR